MHLVGTEPSGLSQGLWPSSLLWGVLRIWAQARQLRLRSYKRSSLLCGPVGPSFWPWLGNQEAWALGPAPFLACSFLHRLGFIIPALLWCRGGGGGGGGTGGGIMQGVGEKVDREELCKGQVPPWDEMLLSCPPAWALT